MTANLDLKIHTRTHIHTVIYHILNAHTHIYSVQHEKNLYPSIWCYFVCRTHISLITNFEFWHEKLNISV